jgi:hypothetical protein
LIAAFPAYQYQPDAHWCVNRFKKSKLESVARQ